MLRHNSRNRFCFVLGFFFLQIFDLGNILEIFDQKSQKTWFLAKKITFLEFFAQNFKIYCLIQKFEKKKLFLEVS